MDVNPILALVVGLGLILAGNALEGGHIDSLIQPTAAMIVLGGTLGATWLASTPQDIRNLVTWMRRVIFPGRANRQVLREELVKVTTVARRDGMLAVEGLLDQVSDDFMRRGLRMLVDGASADDVRRVLEPEIELSEHHANGAGKVLETAGGFAPTVGILGAVLGLIHVMQNLSDPSKLGAGIAVAFVATIYGVGFANLLFLPLGGRIKRIAGEEAEVRTMVLSGVTGVASGVNARLIDEMLSAYTGHHKPSKEAA